MSYLDINIIARFTLKLTIFILIRCKLGRDIVNIEWDRLWNEEGATQNNVQIKKMSKISNKRGRYNDIQDKRRKNGPKRCRSIDDRIKGKSSRTTLRANGRCKRSRGGVSTYILRGRKCIFEPCIFILGPNFSYFLHSSLYFSVNYRVLE